MKNLSGFSYVMMWCLAAVLVTIIFVTATLLTYSILGFLVFFVMGKSYLILGNTWFFIVWPIIIAMAIAYQIYKYFQKRNAIKRAQ